MNINRNNYEEFFLLYVDGELTSLEKDAVDAFIQQHPDLKTELDALKQAVLPIEQISFNAKENLFKNESTAISSANFEEKFLLYVDDELTIDEKEEVEKFVLQNPQYQQAFVVLQQTKLVAEGIACPDKDSLYKKEERRVVYVNWRRLSIAAVLTGLAFLVWTIVPKQNHSVNIDQTASTRIRNNSSSLKQHENISANGVNDNDNNDLVINNISLDHNHTYHSIIDHGNDAINTKQDDVPNTFTELQPIKYTPASIVNENANVIATVSNQNPLHATPLVAKEDNEKMMVQPAVYKELVTDDEDNNSLYIGNLELNKDKVKGLLKKAGRIFARPKNNEEANVAVASFPIGTSK